MSKIAVIGAGSWGCALSQLLAKNGNDIMLWALEPEVEKGINISHKNPIYLSSIVLDDRIKATNSFEEALEGAKLCVMVTPSQFLRSTAEGFKAFVDDDLPIVICSKGAEHDTGLLASEVLADVLGNERRIAVLSGPTHAEEVIKQVYSAATCACSDLELANRIRDVFSSEYFRVYTMTDVYGVELCATFKNVIAIAVGLCYGLGFGDNTAALIITRGVAEMSRMVKSAGGDERTCQGLAGIGDMVVTCMSRHSRNRRFGEDYLSKGKTLDDFKHDTKMIVEGAVAAQNLQTLSRKFNVELPITNMINDIIWNGANVQEQVKVLASRPLKQEF